MSRGPDALLHRVRAVTEGEYDIEGELGRGGMATVFVATDCHLKRKVAIKVMSPELGNVAGIQDRFVIEARTAAYLDHPNIITVYSVKQVEDLLFIVMKFVDGRTLGELHIEGDRIELDLAATIIGRVADALNYAHGEGIVHRDIKPSNIMLDRRGRPIVTDFGIAKMAPGAPTGIATVGPGTIPGTLLGTAAYMSPEQCRGITATAASDQYSLGVTAYELLSGRPLFHGGVLALIDAHKSQEPQWLGELVPGLDSDLESTVMRMLAKDPVDRWGSLQEVALRMGEHAVQAAGVADPRETLGRIAALASAGPRRPWDVPDPSVSTPSPNLAVVPTEPSIQVGESVRLVLSDPIEGSMGGLPVEWRSEDLEVASVDDSGHVTGVAPGVTRITAKAARGVGRATITVTPARLTRIEVTPPTRSLEVGDTAQLFARALDSHGNVVADAAIVWRSTDADVCTVLEDGRIAAHQPGNAHIVASCPDPERHTGERAVQGTTEVEVHRREERTMVAPAVAPPSSESLDIRPDETVVLAPEPEAGQEAESPSEPRVPVLVLGGGLVAVLLALGLWAVFGGGEAANEGGRDVATITAQDAISGDAVGDGAISTGGIEQPDGPTSTDPDALGTPDSAVSPDPESGSPGDDPTDDAAAPNDAEDPVVDPPAVVAGDATTTVDAGILGDPSTPTTDGAPASDDSPPAVQDDPAAPAPLALCNDPALATRTLAGSLASQPAQRIDELYTPVGAEDERAKVDLLDAIRGAGGLTADARAVRSEPAGTDCDWIVEIEFEWTNAFGQPRGRAVQMNMRLMNDSGTARVLRLFGSSEP